MFEEAVLTHFDTSRSLSNSKHRESHLCAVGIYVGHNCIGAVAYLRDPVIHYLRNVQSCGSPRR